MRDLKDRPHNLVLWDVRRGQVFGILHLVGEDEERIFDIAEASGRRLALRCMADSWHLGT